MGNSPRPPLKPDDAKLGVLREGQEAQLEQIVQMCAKAETFGFDTETTPIADWDLDVCGWDRTQGARTCGYSLSWAAGRGVYIPFDHRAGLEGRYPDQMDFETVRDICRPLLEGKLGGSMVTHNLTFDFRMCIKDGLHLKCDHDTSIAAKLISWGNGRWDPKGEDHGSGPRTLKSLEEELCGYEVIRFDDVVTIPEKVKGKKAPPPDYSAMDPFEEIVWRYAAADGSNTLRIHPPLMEILKREQITVYPLEVRLVPPVAWMRHVGVDIDTGMAAAKAAEGRQVADELQTYYREVMTEKLGREINVDLNSPQQLAALLFNEPPEGLGLPVLKRSEKTGAPSTDKEVMKNLASRYPEVQAIQTFKGITKNLGTYLEGYPKRINPITGRVHTNFKPLDTETGRFASSNPNLQNMTKEGLQFDLGDGRQYTANVRDIVVASPGFYFLDFDYSQVEYRAMAGEAGEMGLIEGWRKDANLDVHAQTAALINGCALGDVTGLMRQRGKTMNFAILYGRGAEAIAGDLAVSIEEAQAFLDEYFARLPAVRRWAEQVKLEARRNRFVITKFGRKRFLPEFDHPMPGIRRKGDRLAINTKIQGCCADIMKMAMVRLYERIRREGLEEEIRAVLTVHDSLTLEIAERLTPSAVYPMIREELIGKPIPGWPPIAVDCKIGYRYGSLVDFTETDLANVNFAMPERQATTEPPPMEAEDDEPTDEQLSLDDAPVAVASTVLVEVPGLTENMAMSLLEQIKDSPGENKVVLVISGERLALEDKTSMGPDHPGWVSILGRARVSWAGVDPLSQVKL